MMQRDFWKTALSTGLTIGTSFLFGFLGGAMLLEHYVKSDVYGRIYKVLDEVDRSDTNCVRAARECVGKVDLLIKRVDDESRLQKEEAAQQCLRAQ